MGNRQHILVPTDSDWHTVVVGYDSEANSFYGFAHGQTRPRDDWAHQWNDQTWDWDPQPSPDDGKIFRDFGFPCTRILDPDFILDQGS